MRAVGLQTMWGVGEAEGQKVGKSNVGPARDGGVAEGVAASPRIGTGPELEAQDSDLEGRGPLPGRGPRGLVVSVHDVSTVTWPRVDGMLADLRGLGVGRTSLLVIPDHHGRGRISEDAAFGDWLRARVAEGHEVVAHGYFHRRARRAGDSFAKRLTTERYTAGEGEFFDLAEDVAMELLERGLAEFAAMGMRPSGFVAPAWLLGVEAERAVRRAGFRYTTRIGTVEDLVSGRVDRSRSLVWSVRARWRRVCSLAWNEALLRGLGDSPLVRVGLHPPDWDFPGIRRHIFRCVERALATRPAITYDDWLDRAAVDSTK